jgi:hypothetical protein
MAHKMKIWLKVFPGLLLLLTGFRLIAATGGRISGYIREKGSGEPLIYANVILVGQEIGAASNNYGYFVISGVPAGEYTLRVTYMGYRQQEQSIRVTTNQDQRLDIYLEKENIQGEDVVVTAERARFKEKVEISRTNVSFREIKSAPAFIESDLFRSLQLLPGVTAQNDFSAALIVRGGSPDENLVLIDGTEVYNPYHIGGVFSTFNADAIADAEFLAGGFPAEYGGRISSVLNITSKEGNASGGLLTKNTPLGKYWDLSDAKGEVSVLSSKILLEGPLYKGSWMLSLRRTYFDQMAKIYYLIKGEDQDWIYYFWDGQLKLISDLNSRNRISISSFNGSDRLAFEFNQEDIGIKFNWDWGNNTSNVQWRYVPNARFFSELTLSQTFYDFDVNYEISVFDSVAGTSKNKITVSNQIKDLSLKEKLYFYINSHHTANLGMEYKTLGLSFKYRLDKLVLFRASQKPSITAFYIQDQWKPNALWAFQFGWRISKYELHRQLYYEPRLGLKYNLTENTVLKASYGKYYQFLFTTNDEDEILRIVDFWEPIQKNNQAVSNQHAIIGIEQWLKEGFTASLEMYYKPYSYLLVTNPNNNPASNADDYISGTGTSQGIELLLRKIHGKLTGWIGYSYNLVEKRIDFNGDGIVRKSDGEIYNPTYHRPHNLNIYLSYRINKKNTINLGWTSSSGQPYTPVIGKVFTQSGYGSLENPYQNLVNIDGLKNSARYPGYLRGDLGWVRNMKPFGIQSKFKLQVINFTNHFNVLVYNWNHRRSPSKVSAIGMFPIIPTFGVEFDL